MSIYLKVLFAALVFYSCNDHGETTRVADDKNTTDHVAMKDGPTDVVILCDVSNSISRKDNPDILKRYLSIQNLEKICRELVNKFPPGSLLTYYIISKNAFPIKIDTIRMVTFMKNEEYLQRKRIKESINGICKAIDTAAKYSEDNTCIMTSIENAYNYLKDAKENNSQEFTGYRMIILSDMLEQCPASPVGSIYMSTKNNSLLTKNEFARISNYHPSINLDNVGIDLSVYMLTEDMTVPVSKKIDSAWRIFFNNIGFKKVLDPNYTLLKNY